MNETIDLVRIVKRGVLSCCMGTVGLSAWSQPVCSIDLGPDHTLDAGPVQLNGPSGYSNHLWSTGATSASISVDTPGSYTCQVSYATGNLVTNGSFSAGNSGFTTQFNYSTQLVNDGNYYIGTNAASYHPQFSGTGSGAFMIMNSGWPSALLNVWCQTITVCPGQTYSLSYRVRTVSNAQPARLQWWVDGSSSGPEVTLPSFGGWQTIPHNWTSSAGHTVASFCLRVMSGDGVGNDFGIDDLSISSVVVLSDQVEVFADPLPIELVSFTGEAILGKSHLDWRTASERNNDHFRLLRSSDLDLWEEIDRIPGAGNSQVEQNYHAVDGNPKAGINYYTLVQVDLDGTESVSPVVVVTHLDHDISLKGPNPARVGAPIEFNASIQVLRVTDVVGRSIPHTVSGNSLSIRAGAGVYVVTLQGGAGLSSVRVVLE
ncbi:MAG: hypothetical protein WEC15_03200 [Flavobacteriales bacterium]